MPAPRGNKNNLRHGIHSGGFDQSDLSALAGLIAEGLPDEPEEWEGATSRKRICVR